MDAAANPEMRRVVREGALLAGGARAILLQIAHPKVAQGVADHSNFVARPLDRLRASATYVYCVTFGTPDEVRAVSHLVNQAHRRVTGPGYRATDPELQLWVAATLYETGTMVYEQLFGRLDEETAERAYLQNAVLATALQVPDQGEWSWPADRAAFRSYWDHMVATLEVSDAARAVARDLLRPPHAPLALRAAMPLNRFLTTAWMPPRLRQDFGLPWDAGRQRRFEALMKAGTIVYPRIPTVVREAPKTYYLRDMRRRLSREPAS